MLIIKRAHQHQVPSFLSHFLFGLEICFPLFSTPVLFSQSWPTRRCIGVSLHHYDMHARRHTFKYIQVGVWGSGGVGDRGNGGGWG